MGRYILSDKAAADLSSLWDGYTERGGSEESANRLVDELLGVFQDLADFPNIGTPRDYLSDEASAFPHKRYMVYYEKREYGVEIVQVLYGGIDLESYFSSQD